MAWKDGFFNSVNGDRVYNAETMNKIFEGLITNGVYESVGNKLVVQPNSDMVIQIGTGRGWFNNHWVNNTSLYLITVDPSDVTLNRWVGVFIKVDESDENRSAQPYLRYSEFATNPVKPVPTRSNKVNEYCLAYIYLRAGATKITAADIVDTRGNNNLCGWVTGLITQLDTTTLFEQWEAIFNNWSEEQAQAFTDWFNSLQNLIDENVATMLVSALPVSQGVVLSAANWTRTGNIYTQTVDVINMNNTKSVIAQPEESTLNLYNDNSVKCFSQGTNSLTFTSNKLPTGDITVNVLHMGR